MNIENVNFGRKPDVDWGAVKTDYEAGDLSVREIARRHGVSDTSVHKHARAEVWKGLQPADLPLLSPPQTEVQTKIEPVQTSAPVGRKPVAFDDWSRDDNEFDWSRNNDSVLLHDQAATAIYRNPWDQIVIRQERAWDENEDIWIRFNPEHLPRVIERLQALLAGAEPMDPVSEWLRRLAADHDGAALIVAKTVGSLMCEHGADAWFKRSRIATLTEQPDAVVAGILHRLKRRGRLRFEQRDAEYRFVLPGRPQR